MAQFYAPNFSGLLPLFDGKSAAGGKLYAYKAGSSVPAPLYNEDGVSLGSWVSIDSNGCADFLLSSALTYKLVVKDALGATLGEWDNVSATNAPGMTNPLTAEGSLIVGGTAGEPTELPAGSEGQALKIVSGVPAWATDAEGMQNPMTTEGDLIVGSTDGEPSRLGVGAAGQVLTSDGTTASWETPAAPGMSNPMTTAGDLIVGGASGTPGRLGVGTDGHVLTLSSGAPTWAAPATQPGDHKLLTTSADTSAGYLADKLVAGSNVTLTTQTDGDGVQTIEIAAAGGGGGGGLSRVVLPFAPISDTWFETPYGSSPTKVAFFMQVPFVNAKIKRVYIGYAALQRTPDTIDVQIYSSSNGALPITKQTSFNGLSVVLDGYWGGYVEIPETTLAEHSFIGVLTSTTSSSPATRVSFWAGNYGNNLQHPAGTDPVSFRYYGSGDWWYGRRTGWWWKGAELSSLPVTVASSDLDNANVRIFPWVAIGLA